MKQRRLALAVVDYTYMFDLALGEQHMCVCMCASCSVVRTTSSIIKLIIEIGLTFFDYTVERERERDDGRLVVAAHCTPCDLIKSSARKLDRRDYAFSKPRISAYQS